MSNYQKVRYMDSYLFKDFEDNYNYYHTLTSDSGDLIDNYFSDSDILNLSVSGLKLWVDSTHTNSILFSSTVLHVAVTHTGSGYQTTPLVYISGGPGYEDSSTFLSAILSSIIVPTMSAYPLYPLSSISANSNYSHIFQAITAKNGFITSVQILSVQPKFYRSTPTLIFSGGNLSGQLIDFKEAEGYTFLEGYIEGLVDRVSSYEFLVQQENGHEVNPKLEIWPLATSYTSYISGVRINNSSYLANSAFYFNFYEPFTIFLVWKNDNVLKNSTPFNLVTIYNSLCTDLIYSVNQSFSSHAIFGVRGENAGWSVSELSTFYTPEITKFTHTSAYNEINVLSSYTFSINNSSIQLANNYGADLSKLLLFNTIGYNLPDTNNFIFGELLLFNRILNEIEHIKLYNYLSQKWNFNNFIDYYTPVTEVTGGPFSRYSYEDYSTSTSQFNLPIQACVTNLTLSFSSFDESVSLINQIIYEYKGFTQTVSTSVKISAVTEDTFVTTNDYSNQIHITLEPDEELQLSNYQINLSVVRFDTTINKIILNGSILKCAVNDLYSDTHLLDSQLMDETSKIVLILEDKQAKQLYLNSLDTTILNVHMTGGDVQMLKNNEVEVEEENIVSLADLLNDAPVIVGGSKLPPIIPFAPPNINPIRPS
jgi:hypothetical protein